MSMEYPPLQLIKKEWRAFRVVFSKIEENNIIKSCFITQPC